jgi:hypothetical protein
MGATITRGAATIRAAAFAALLASLAGLMVVGALLGSGPAPSDETAPSAQAVADIPAEFLHAYQGGAAQFEPGPLGWSFLAAIGKVESDHGRSRAPGVRSGQNANGCCAGPMQLHNGFGSGGGTWGAFQLDGSGDGVADIYHPADAAFTAARYLHASGAPDDWHRAVFAYNHAEWYVERVLTQAAQYRKPAASAPPTLEGHIVPFRGRWLADVPGQPGDVCDSRIVPDVALLVRQFGVRLTDCYGGVPHQLNGEHPLGLATDLVPSDGRWDRTERLAETFGWRPACAPTGCPGQGPFRVILYNGFPGHGDPSHTASPHLHLSWEHAPARPFSPARWVRTLLDPFTTPADPKGAAP